MTAVRFSLALVLPDLTQVSPGVLAAILRGLHAIMVASATETGYRCPFCGGTTHLPEDVRGLYCPCCGSPPTLPKVCPHNPTGWPTRVVV